MPYISEETINKIKDNLSIVAVIKDYVKLKKAGRNWKGPCPFHIEKDPSFSVSEEKGLYHCFGCNASGNMFNFIMEIEKAAFPESIEILAKKAGITVEYKKGADNKINKEKELIHKVNAKAAFIFHFYLKDKPEGEKARLYLKERQISPEMIEIFKLGFAPDDFQKLYNELLNEHFVWSTILKAGLCLKSKKGSGYYDRFRNRLIFPIINTKDNIIGFGGRTMDTDIKQAKYLNTAETEIFSKRSNLYGLNVTRNHIREKHQAIVVEGYFDLISLFQADIKNVVAPLGTALTNEQVLLLKRYADEIVLLFDSDKAGNTATIRSISLLLNTDLNIKIAGIPSGTDPDEFVLKHGKEALIKLIDSAPSFLRFIVKDGFNKYENNTADGKNKILQHIFPILKQVNDEILKSEVFRYLANKLSVDENILLNEFSKFSSTGQSPILKKQPGPDDIPSSIIQAERYVVMTLLEKPEYSKLISKNINFDHFNDQLSLTILKNIKELHHNKEEITADRLINKIEDNKIKEFIAKESISEKYSHDIKKQLNDCIFKIKLQKIDKLIKLENDKIKKSGDFNEIKILEQEMQVLFNRKHELKKNKASLIK